MKGSGSSCSTLKTPTPLQTPDIISLAPIIAGTPVVFEDVAREGGLQYPEQAMVEGIRAMITVPINFCGEFIGALRLYHLEPWRISAQDLDSLLLLAENVGLALTYTRLLNAVQCIRETLDELPAGAPLPVAPC